MTSLAGFSFRAFPFFVDTSWQVPSPLYFPLMVCWICFPVPGSKPEVSSIKGRGIFQQTQKLPLFGRENTPVLF